MGLSAVNDDVGMFAIRWSDNEQYF